MFGSGNSQTSTSLISSIDFSPVINFGQDNKGEVDKTNDQTSSLTPKQDNSTTASVGVGLGGSGSGGSVQRVQDENSINPLKGLNARDKNKIFYLLGGAIGLTGVYLIVKSTKQKKRK